ncbi:MAG: InlB B-repeat-containing protein [Clostridia bacterium]|nr:InlB B-repeat-containing protein [Clostridia bacterium]
MKRIKKFLMPIALVMLISLTLPMMFVGAESEGADVQIDIGYCNLSFKDSVRIKYAVSTSEANTSLLIWTEEQSEYTYGTHTTELKNAYNDTISGAPYKVFDYNRLSAKQMTDVVYARAYAVVDGEAHYSEVVKYSILQYAYNKLGKTAEGSDNAALCEMLEKMLDYGASAQKYFDEYKIDRLATAEWYQVKLTAGAISDGSNHGLYLPGDKVKITAPLTDADGATFSHWADADGNKLSSDASCEITVGEKNVSLTPVYVKYSSGLEFDSNGDGTCYVVGMGECGDTELVIPPKSPDGDTVIGIDGSAFASQPIVSVYIPDTVTEIARRAFNGCTALTDVYYDGSADAWSAISISSGNDPLTSATLHLAVVESFTVTFVDYDGTVLKTEMVKSGDAATAPDEPSRAGFVFSGWDSDFSLVTGDITVTAKYEEIAESTVYVNSTKVSADAESVDVVISIAANPGIASLILEIEFDDTLFTLSKVTFDPAFGSYVTAPEPFGNPQKISLISPLADIDASGALVTLTFTLADGVEAGDASDIKLNLDAENTFNSDFDPVSFTVLDGKVTVI